MGSTVFRLYNLLWWLHLVWNLSSHYMKLYVYILTTRKFVQSSKGIRINTNRESEYRRPSKDRQVSGGEQTKPSRPDILLLSRYDGRCNIRHQDTRIQTPSGWRSQEWRQDAVDKRSNGHGRVNLIISGYRGGLDTYIRDPHHQATHSVTTLSYTLTH